ncbi:helix-turn-helix domain-containing protein [Cohnella nanjingensis]|uniref:AraC family transcriptional regulator n=1 Tax=Cohnella nanjingensis TaxID=1387779 RepID=A0A7X0RUQ3_9BACL|nr:helix-turn-helix domain-containing protein [Cohnella nanjingensis]MBB6674042.1 AraC family transcriptional regulator [Cohnella nanjingensis]
MSFARFKLDSLFARILLSFTILVMIIIVTITLIFSNLYAKTLYGQLSQEQVKGLEMLSENIDNLFKEMDQIYLNLEINTDINFFLASRSNDELINNKARIQIRNIRQINPYIHSIFVYNSSINEYIVEGEPGFDAQGFLKRDASFQKSVNDARTIYLTRLENTNAAKSFLTDKNANYVISMEYTNRSMNGQQQTVIINLDDNLLVRDYLSKSGDQLLFADEAGTLIAHSDVAQIGGSVKGTASFEAVLSAAAAADAGDVIDDEGHHQSLVTFVKNRTTSWYILSATPYHSLVKPIQDKRNALLVVCLSILLFCLALTFLISKKLYNPVQRLTELFKRSQFNVGSAVSSDISLIGRVYAETLQHMQSLEDKNRDSLQLMKDNFLRRALISAGPDEPSVALHADEWRLRIDLDRLLVCVFKIDGYSQLDAQSMTLYESVLFQSIAELLSDELRYEVLQMPKGEIALLINEANGAEDGFRHLLAKLANVKDSIAVTIGITVSVGVSDPIDAWGDCPHAYRQALEMIQQRFVLGPNRIIYPQLVEETLSRSYGLPIEIEDKLISAIKRNDRESFVQGLDSMTGLLKGYVHSDAIQALFHILLVCITQMNQTINDENKKLGMQFGELNLIFTEMETLEQARAWLLKRFEDYRGNLESIQQLKENKFYRKIEETMQYIQDNFADSNLSVEVLAEVAGYTPNYFSKLFKEMTGINSGEYIRKIRIGKAKDFLQSDEYKVSDVAQMCGYINSSHFYSAFKKEVGMTPTAYREYSLSEKEPKRNSR